MQWRYHELRGKHVRSRDGHDLGSVTDLVAEPQDDALRVAALLVGRAGILRRVAFKDIPLGARRPLRVPWRVVAGIDDEIHLTVDRGQLNVAGTPAESPDERQKQRHSA